MARTGRPAKPIELHKRQGTYRPDRHGPKPMLASPPLVRSTLVYTVPFDAPVDLELFANQSWRYVHSETGGAPPRTPLPRPPRGRSGGCVGVQLGN